MGADQARGATSPEEHRRRIFALRNTLEDEDEQIRFETRARVMEAAHELIQGMTFSPTPLGVEIMTRGGVLMDLALEEWGDQKGITWAKFSPELQLRQNGNDVPRSRSQT